MYKLEQGDTLIISVRKTTITKDSEGKEQKLIKEDILSEVNVGDPMTVAGGSVKPEWDDGQQSLVIRLKSTPGV